MRVRLCVSGWREGGRVFKTVLRQDARKAIHARKTMRYFARLLFSRSHQPAGGFICCVLPSLLFSGCALDDWSVYAITRVGLKLAEKRTNGEWCVLHGIQNQELRGTFKQPKKYAFAGCIRNSVSLFSTQMFPPSPFPFLWCIGFFEAPVFKIHLCGHIQ